MIVDKVKYADAYDIGYAYPLSRHTLHAIPESNCTLLPCKIKVRATLFTLHMCILLTHGCAVNEIAIGPYVGGHYFIFRRQDSWFHCLGGQYFPDQR